MQPCAVGQSSGTTEVLAAVFGRGIFSGRGASSGMAKRFWCKGAPLRAVRRVDAMAGIPDRSQRDYRPLRTYPKIVRGRSQRTVPAEISAVFRFAATAYLVGDLF